MTTEPSAPDASGHWSAEHRVELLLARPELRSMLDACTRNATTSMSADQFLARAAAAMPIPFTGAAMLRGAARGRRTALRIGVRTGKSASAEFAAPIGYVTAAVLCSLARNTQPLTSVEDLKDGSALTAEIQPDRKTFGGVLTIELRGTSAGTTLSAQAAIPGQIYDWGKSKQTLATLIADVPALLPR
jgi:hypothetical protein